MIDMGESRERFDEAAAMILDALDNGFIEGDGPYYRQVRTEIRPRPLSGFRDRLYCVGMSPESVLQAAELGARLMVFSQQPWESFAESTLAEYRDAYRDRHRAEAPAPLTGDLLLCHRDGDRARDLAREHMAAYFVSVVRHYELLSEHFQGAKGYEYYASTQHMLREIGVADLAERYVDVQTWGTPDDIVDKLAKRRELLGDFELNVIPAYGGLDPVEAEASVGLFADAVLPEISTW